MAISEFRFCPKCGGNLEERIVKDNGKIKEIVFACLGVCGTIWSLYDLTLISKTDA